MRDPQSLSPVVVEALRVSEEVARIRMLFPQNHVVQNRLAKVSGHVEAIFRAVELEERA